MRTPPGGCSVTGRHSLEVNPSLRQVPGSHGKRCPPAACEHFFCRLRSAPAMDELEVQIQSLYQSGDLRAAATKTIEGYGPEVFGFLVALLHDERDACDVFSQTCEDLWIGLPRFEGRCAIRTWLYTLARHAAARLRRSPHGRPGRHVGLSKLTDKGASVASSTPFHLRTEVKNQIASIRNSLPLEDRALLVLRVDREMSWREIAFVFSPEASSGEVLRRAEGRLRKRFQLVKDEIRSRAREAGLLPPLRSTGASHPRLPAR